MLPGTIRKQPEIKKGARYNPHALSCFKTGTKPDQSGSNKGQNVRAGKTVED